MNVPADLYYTQDHEWVRVEGNIATIGITDWAQGELGDIVFVELPQVDDSLSGGDTFGTIEAVKAVSELYSPVNGKVVEVNSALDDDPMVINSDPYGSGWMIKIELADTSQLDGLLTSQSYEELTK